MPLCRLCQAPHFVGISGWGNMSSICMDCAERERKKNGWLSHWCKPKEKPYWGLGEHGESCEIFWNNKFCQCQCHKK